MSSDRRRLDAFTHSSDEDDDGREAVASYSKRGAETKRVVRDERPAPPRMIPLTSSNLDWREDRRRRIGARTNIQQLGPLVSMRRAGQTESSTASVIADVDKIDSEGQKRGLEFHTRRDAPAPIEPLTPPPPPPPQATVPVDGDQEAIQALLAGQSVGNGNASGADHLVIPQQDEAQVLQNDIDTRPDAPTLDDYAAVPIEQFGMAMLRGMGWSEGKGKGPHSATEPKKRASLLGLGAKERQSSLPSLSSSSSRSHQQHKRDYRYTPLTKVSDRRRDERSEPSSRDHHARDRHHRSRDRSASPPRRKHHRH